MTHWLPQWLLDLGSVGGLVTVVFLIVDRLLKGRPKLAVGVGEHGRRHLNVITQPGIEISISAFRSRGGIYRLSKDSEVRSLLRASEGALFPPMTIPGGTSSKFVLIPTMVSGSSHETLADRYRWTPIWVTWRKSTSIWLPQIPAFTIVDNDWLRSVRNGTLAAG